MSKVLGQKEKKIFSHAGLRLDKIIRRRRRERDLRLKTIKYVRNG